MATLNVSPIVAGLSAATSTQWIAGRKQLEVALPHGRGDVEPKADASFETTVSAKPESKSSATQLTPEQKRQVAALARIDQEVRAHEAAHLRVGAGVVTSAANFSYTYGPDGKSYAVAGEVGIDTSPEQAPEANIDKGQRIRIVALAPAEPSPQDYRVAAIGSRIEQMGYAGLAQQQVLELAEKAAAQRAEQTRRSDGIGNVGPSDATGNATREVLARSYPPPATGSTSGISLFA
ncbi:MAG: hypothetical protein A3H93_03825 [Rhodocyclales bacterium RIFCSPLOWO2_02_FULL_63_24]|nr:MAG: hypothetical protein A3H93_03825 [Rhodocyclales bacterium RIFCSPLOWO2_02_FULL_63_24]